MKELIREIKEKSKGKKIYIFSDLDGTLHPLVDDPAGLMLTQKEAKILGQLVELDNLQMIIITGRLLSDAQKRIRLGREGVSKIDWIGNHGIEFAIGGEYFVSRKYKKFLPLFEDLKKNLEETFKDFEGVIIEDKKFMLAVHWKLADPSVSLKLIVKKVKNLISGKDKLKGEYQGEKTYEIRPNFEIKFNKGIAIDKYLSKYYEDTKGFYCMAIGDSNTDKDMFENPYIQDGAGILVGNIINFEDSGARYHLKRLTDLYKLFEFLIGRKLRNN